MIAEPSASNLDALTGHAGQDDGSKARPQGDKAGGTDSRKLAKDIRP
jgi:hypothetical protein